MSKRSFIVSLGKSALERLLAQILEPLLQGELLRQFCAVGYVLVACIGINFMGGYKIKTANFLPALLVPPLWYGIQASLLGG